MGGKSSDEQTTTTRVEIPPFLRSFLSTSAGIGNQALRELRGNLGDEDTQLVQRFTPAQEAAQGLGIQRALGADGLIPGAQRTAFSISQGGVPGTGALQGMIGQNALPPETLQTLTGATQGGQLSGADVLQNLSAGGQFQGADVLSELAQGGQLAQLQGGGVPQETLEALQQTARGDFLAGGPGFQEGIDAAVRQATPAILSTFGQGGAGAATGGLAQTAIGTAAADAFARQFGQERGRQLSAANQLGQFGLAGRGQEADIASQLDQSRRAAASQLGQFGLQGQGLQADVASQLAGLDLSQTGQQIGAAERLGQFGLSQQGQQADIAGLLGQLGLGGQGRQLEAAEMIPRLAATDVNLLSEIGDIQQQQRQRELVEPLTRQNELLSIALSGLPISSLLGQGTTQPVNRNRAAGALGGGLTGAQIGGKFGGPWGAAIGGIGGALLGSRG